MGMFTINAYSEGASIDMDSIVAQECFEDNMHTAALRVVAESESNWNQIMQAMAIHELASYEETGDTDYYVTEAGTGFLESVKAFFKKLMEKIKGIFAKFMSIVDSWTKSDKDFIRKYKDKILKVNTHDFEYEGYKFTYANTSQLPKDTIRDDIKSDTIASHTDPTKVLTGTFDKNKANEYKSIAEEFRGDKLDDKLDATRAAIIKKLAPGDKYSSTSCDASDFSSDLFEALRNGESSKETIDDVSPAELISTISQTEKIKQNARKFHDNLQKGLKDLIKQCDEWSRAISRDMPSKDNNDEKGKYVAAVGAYSGFLRNCQTLWTTGYGAYLQALKDENRQAKSVCVKLMSYKAKNESTSYYEEGSSLLGNIRMI